jgi:CheY-like chemotaxis protein
MLRRIIGEDVRLELSLAPDLPAINADPSQIEQVIMNLAVNARDAMPNGGQLMIHTSERLLTGADEVPAVAHLSPGKYVQLRVTDTGSGIPDGLQSRIFEPFFTTKPPGKGTGLGLSTVYGIMARASGAIYVESEPGSGTSFTAVFPGFPAERPIEDTRTVSPATGAETVLVVEDEANVRRYVQTVLVKNGYTVMEAANGEDALKIVRDHTSRIDLVLADVVMPGMGGIELARALASLCPRMRMLLMSGYSDRPASEFPLLPKPFTQPALLNRIRTVLDG